MRVLFVIIFKVYSQGGTKSNFRNHQRRGSAISGQTNVACELVFLRGIRHLIYKSQEAPISRRLLVYDSVLIRLIHYCTWCACDGGFYIEYMNRIYIYSSECLQSHM